MQQHPLGFLEYREALGPSGSFGRWLRKRPAVAKVGDVVFLHGGLHPELASWDLEALNQRIHKEMESFDTYTRAMVEQGVILPFFTLAEKSASVQAALAKVKGNSETGRADKREVTLLEEFLKIGNWLGMHPDGPLWFRGFAQWSEEEGQKHLSGLLRGQKAAHFVVGHTPDPPGAIRVRFGGKVFLIDTGMFSRYYPGGRASALEIHHGRFTAIYTDEQRTLIASPPGQ